MKVTGRCTIILILYLSAMCTSNELDDVVGQMAMDNETQVMTRSHMDISRLLDDHNILKHLIEDPFLRHPIGIILHLDHTTADVYTNLWQKNNIYGKFSTDINIIYVLFDVLGIRSSSEVINQDKLRHLISSTKTTEIHGGGTENMLKAIVQTTNMIPYDSAILLFTNEYITENETAKMLTQTLIRKRCKLHVIWTGEQHDNSNELLQLRSISRATGAMFYYPETEINVKLQDQFVLVSQSEMYGTVQTRIPVEGGMDKIEVNVNGEILEATLLDPLGTIQKSELKNGIIFSVNVTESQKGTWILITQGEEDQVYNITVYALFQEKVLGRQKREMSRNHVHYVDSEETIDNKKMKNSESYSGIVNNSAYAKMTAKDKNGTQITTISSKQATISSKQQRGQAEFFIPISVELQSGTNLNIIPGTQATINFEVTNNQNFRSYMIFRAVGENVARLTVYPEQQFLSEFQTITVQMNVYTTTTSGNTGKVSLIVDANGSRISRSAYLYMDKTYVKDNWKPEFSYNFKGDCANTNEPTNCRNGRWSLEATVRDKDSGLLKISSEPLGLLFDSEFTAGTRESIRVTYTATCCEPRVDIWAEDLQGNYIKKELDSEYPILREGEIAAVVLGVLGLILIIILIVLIILLCRQRRNKIRLELPRHRSGSH